MKKSRFVKKTTIFSLFLSLIMIVSNSSISANRAINDENNKTSCKHNYVAVYKEVNYEVTGEEEFLYEPAHRKEKKETRNVCAACFWGRMEPDYNIPANPEEDGHRLSVITPGICPICNASTNTFTKKVIVAYDEFPDVTYTNYLTSFPKVVVDYYQCDKCGNIKK